ncbi:hypothetical protein F4777DRAFT_84314 [Nemania sp. FL0916]|nr:hypothetical protein F4777DRAFT_84314 [Nemania sp. FL0916]
MDVIRNSLVGRRPRQGEPDPDPDPELQGSTDADRLTRNTPRTSSAIRPVLHSIIAGRLSRGRRFNRDEAESDNEPRSRADRLSFPSAHDMTNQLPPERRIQENEAPPQLSRVHIRTQRFPILSRPPANGANERESERHVRRSIFHGPRLADLHLVDHAKRRRHCAQERRDGSDSSRRYYQRELPKKFLFCFPWVKSRRARALILRCFVSGALLVSMLTVYLSLSITKSINTSEFSILLIILILLTTIVFCHGLILLCMLIVRPRNRQGVSGNDVEANKFGHLGYAIPRQPIRVVLARDEEAAGIVSEEPKLGPPAYGMWRESVRVDPNRIYWQRAGPAPSSSPTSISSTSSDSSEEGSPHSAHRRPPSYASDDGVDYVVDARPRSIAPPPSSIYSQPSAIATPMTSDVFSMPPLPQPVVTAPLRPTVARRLNH